MLVTCLSGDSETAVSANTPHTQRQQAECGRCAARSFPSNNRSSVEERRGEEIPKQGSGREGKGRKMSKRC